MIERYFHEKEGYNPFLIEDNWQVAQLNYLPKHGLDDIDDVEVHVQTDEVFVLTKGTGVLIAADLTGDEIVFECVNMQQGVTNNIPAVVWHNIAMDKEASMIIVEKANTHLNDCKHQLLDEKTAQRLYAEIAKLL